MLKIYPLKGIRRHVCPPCSEVFPALSAYLSDAEFLYSDNKYYEFCGKMGCLIGIYDIGKSQLAHLVKAMCRGLSGKRASVCNLPEPTLADSRASHVQTPEAICYRRSYWYSE